MKIKAKHIYIFIISFILFVGCISPYYPTVTRYEDILVVDGQLTNLAGPYKVKLSRSFTFKDKAGIPLQHAVVKIIDNTGLEVQLKGDINPTGEYSTTDTTFHGVPGKSYKLQIKIDDIIYESAFETLKKPIPVDKFYWEFRPQSEFAQRGIQLLVDTHDSENSTRYYMWDFDETWKFRVPIYVTNKPEWIECYTSNPSRAFNINTSIQRHNDVIDQQPIMFINEATNRLYTRYTMLVKQYTLSEQAYKYLDEMIKSNMNQGTLFDQIPYSLFGNMKCVTNKEIPVVGYFLVTGASEKRIFIDRSELPKEFNPTSGFEYCFLETAVVSVNLASYRQNPKVDSLMNYGYQIFETYDPNRRGFIGLKLARPFCFNCTLQGDNKVPSFWTEKSN